MKRLKRPLKGKHSEETRRKIGLASMGRARFKKDNLHFQL